MASEQKKLVKKEVDTYAAIEAVSNLQGGKILIKSLKKDIVASIDTIISRSKSATNLAELMAPAIALGERLAMLRTLKRATKNKKFALRELEEILKDEPDEQE